MTAFIIIAAYLLGYAVAFFALSKLLLFVGDTKLTKYDIVKVSLISIFSWLTVVAVLLIVFVNCVVSFVETSDLVDQFTEWVNNNTLNIFF